MKALTLHEPWASLIACGIKTIETRDWPTKYRGPLAIHAAKRKMDHVGMALWWEHRLDIEPTEDAVVAYGMVVATCELVDVVLTDDLYMPTVAEPDRIADRHMRSIPNAQWAITENLPYGDFSRGRYAWLLHNVKPLVRPIISRGYQRIWNWEIPETMKGN